MIREEVICSIALSHIPKLGTVNAKRLIEMAGSASLLFEQSKEWVAKGLLAPNWGDELRNQAHRSYAEAVCEEAEQKGVELIPLASSRYPRRLKECEDAPILLYYKGDTNLDTCRIISIVGTRLISPYGREMCQRIVSDLAAFDSSILVVSGLAYGVDVEAHTAALKCGLNTLGVLAHGLDQIYPSRHRNIAVQMVAKGGLLTEFPFNTHPTRFSFVSRNRIVAGLSDATIVIESAQKGGSLITADLANGYNRDCFAVPGRVSDQLSVGCNQLIKEDKAILIESGVDVINYLGWHNKKKTSFVKQQELFIPNLSEEEERLVSLFREKGDLLLDNLVVMSDIPIHQLHPILFELEMKGVIQAQVGGTYHLV